MTPMQMRDSVRALQEQGHSLREISRLLHISRNTVRRILRQAATAARGSSMEPALQERLKDVYARAQGNAVRMGQILADEDGRAPPYSTLTRWVREAELRTAPKRAGRYHFAPGQEMQHDTSPHRVVIAGKPVTAQCAALTLACSRRLFVRYYPRFTRLEAKHFLLQAALFMQGTCARCVIDNTSVVLAGGAGPQAVFAPEMVALAATLGFAFMAHRVGDPDRKGRIERPFFYVQTNFLPGRTFADFEDLNAQALRWCVEVANAKPKRDLGCSPEQAYRQELAHLHALPAALPPVYEVLDRVVDLYGFVSVDTNRYSVPERLVGKTMTVYKHYEQVEIHHRGTPVAVHPRLVDQREARHVIAGHHTLAQRAPREPALEQQLLRGANEVLQRYAAALKARRPHGQGVRALRRLLQIKRTYPPEPFEAAVQQALKFGLFDLARLEHLVLKHVAGDFFALGGDEDGDDDDHRP
jgi:transposase